MKKTVDVEAKTLKVYLKVCDEFSAELLDDDGITLKHYEGYVFRNSSTAESNAQPHPTACWKIEDHCGYAYGQIDALVNTALDAN